MVLNQSRFLFYWSLDWYSVQVEVECDACAMSVRIGTGVTATTDVTLL